MKNITVLLDSSNTSLTVALAKQNALIDSVSYEAWQSQSEHMIPELDNLLNKNLLTKDDISSVMVAIGPGSYTGVRIAVTIAKTLSVALNVPVKTISSLQILKKNNEPSICLINARSGRSYFAVYEGTKCLIADQIKTNDEVKEYINEHKEYVVCGNTNYLGLEGYSTDIAEQMSLLNNEDYVSNPLAVSPVYMYD